MEKSFCLLIRDKCPIHRHVPYSCSVFQCQLLTSAFSSVPGADPTPNPERHSHPEQQTSHTGASGEFPTVQNKVSL